MSKIRSNGFLALMKLPVIKTDNVISTAICLKPSVIKIQEDHTDTGEVTGSGNS